MEESSAAVGTSCKLEAGHPQMAPATAITPAKSPANGVNVLLFVLCRHFHLHRHPHLVLAQQVPNELEVSRQQLLHAVAVVLEAHAERQQSKRKARLRVQLRVFGYTHDELSSASARGVNLDHKAYRIMC
eukprot:6200410-Pleurochrysis_carterae.AAC.2